jgi:hypothetical protein
LAPDDTRLCGGMHHCAPEQVQRTPIAGCAPEQTL